MRLWRRHATKKRLLRWGIVVGNLAILVVVFSLMAVSDHTSGATASVQALSSSNASAGSELINPLDQLSAADIAVNVARLDRLPEATAVANQADSVNVDLAIAPEGSDNVLSKPQVVATALKSRSDIQKYVTANGDTISSIAAKFGVTSDSVRWSNGLSSNLVAAGQTLYIPPVNGIVYTVKSGDTPDSLAQKFRTSKDRIIAANDAELAGIKVGEQILIPDGSQPAPVVAASYTNSYSGGGFAWGSTAIYGSNGYDYGWCTWYVANRRTELGHPVPSNLGDAYSWYRAAIRAGLPTGLSPRVGAVMVNEGGDHVAVVEQVNPDGSYWISEMNSHGQVSMTNATPTGGWGVRDYKVMAAGSGMKFIY